MALNLGGKKPQAEPQQESQAASPPAEVHHQAKPSGGSPSFIKTGKEAQAALEKEEKRQAERGNQTYRFYLKEGSEGSITFLDGDLDENGLLAVPMWYEHNVQLNGKYGNFFICLHEETSCPLCESGQDNYFAAGLTVIDHSEYKGKDQKVYKDQKRLFVAKPQTLKILNKIAVKRGGLRGCTFDVARTGEMSASVGSMFDFTEKHTDNELLKLYGEEGSKRLNYEEILAVHYHDESELRKLGFGVLSKPVGSEPPLGDSSQFKDKL